MTVERIFTRPRSPGPQLEHERVKVVAGAGIEGDRYFDQHDEPGQNITLVEAEEIEGFMHQHNRPRDWSATGRNVVTRGVRLNALVGHEFFIGTVRFRGVELCEPCLGMGERLQSAELPAHLVVRHWVHRAGLRADALSSGDIAVGARVTRCQMDPPIVEQGPEAEAALNAYLDDRIYQFNIRATGFQDGRPFAGVVKDDAGVITAAINGHTWGGCCYVAHLWVEESQRRKGVGRALLRAAENEAIVRGCAQVLLLTHSFQAPEFYEQLGYTRQATIPDYPRGYAQHVYLKQLKSEPHERSGALDGRDQDQAHR